MKILHIATSVVPQSASYRIHHAELKMGMDSYMYILSGDKLDAHIIVDHKPDRTLGLFKFITKKACRLVEKLALQMCINEVRTPISLGSVSLINQQIVDEIAPDIINLHWVCGGFVSAKDLQWLSKYKVVWTMHDSWAFTGGCHIPYDCKKYVLGCTDCPQLKAKIGFNIVKKFFLQKLKWYQKTNISVVTPSHWLAGCVLKSKLLCNNTVKVIPNPLDISKFLPIEKEIARKLLGVSIDSKVVLFGAMNSTSDENKGFEYLHRAFKKIYLRTQDEKIKLLIFGSERPKETIEFGFSTTYLGRLHDELSLVLAYSAADVMVVPSKSENFPNTILEAMACGTPCVAFGIGGITEQIDQGINGYLAKPYDSNELAEGILRILLDEKLRRKMANNARNKIINNYSEKKIAKLYFELYKSLV